MTVPVPLTDNDSHTIDVGPVYCPTCKREYGNTEAEVLREALRIAVEGLHEVAVDHEPMPVNDGRDWCSKCQNYMRGDSGCTAADARAALAAVRELVDLGEKPCRCSCENPKPGAHAQSCPRFGMNP